MPAGIGRSRLWWIGLIGITTFTLGYFIGHLSRTTQTPLIIERSSPEASGDSSTQNDSQLNSTTNLLVTSEAYYICGARTKKGRVCKRRVRERNTRCFQHQGRPAILPVEKLIVKN